MAAIFTALKEAMQAALAYGCPSFLAASYAVLNRIEAGQAEVREVLRMHPHQKLANER